MKNEIIKGIHVYVVFKFNGTFSTFSNKITRGGGDECTSLLWKPFCAA